MLSSVKLLGAGLAIAGAIALWWLFHANGKLHAEIGTLEQQLQEAQHVASKNLDAFNRVDALQKQCVSERAVDEQQNAVTAAQLRADLISVTSRAQQVRVVRQEIFRDPTCKELVAIDIAAQCPAWANELRFGAQAINPNRSAGGSGAGANADAGRVLPAVSAGIPVH